MKTIIKYTYQGEEKQEEFTSLSAALISADQLSMLGVVSSVVLIYDGKEVRFK